MVDYILSRKSERKMTRDVKVVKIECIKQHRLLMLFIYLFIYSLTAVSHICRINNKRL